MNAGQPKNDRLVELLTARAVHGLSEAETAELEQLLQEVLGTEDRTLDVAAAAIDIAFTQAQPMPAGLMAKLDLAADAHFAPGAKVPTGATVVPFEAARRRRLVTWGGWIAAAACLVLALGAWLRSGVGPGAGPSATAQREELLKTAKDAVVVSWAATKDPAAQGAAGDVVWSESQQRGYMRFHGLAANDPKQTEYQLWIFDKQQDERYPVDGGVFDVDRTTGDVVVPIHAKIHVAEPTLFAVTVEKPGGVVVSKRERIVVTAAVKTG